ncbi:multisubunit sodium/proton antiporter, MrpA subunit /multisubunit sodium/proton antiporter, MrpB subunit [Plantibacter sp. VKM Ac-1784]|uniref:Multisubunit sodium/proton antiporter, MrpA subunit /multisubunit sodium/proton antiporter, MrpB subunit n=1 Tax=Plantibacter elymi (nom. nud.) TaxID=199708 RepID=A0ABY1RFY8_9MICO|nr:Na+/H+ antiporter subunit A [Plantibacter sp. VKM Ac-1784]SMQ67431.1 multisubunit sodium/proton antiporter, MrpA subunit /multisubunit sodium/proton antiporter, MrpB subunit [Plantibacter sp. VKM Ac-1784]
MATILLVFAAIAVATPTLTRVLSTKVFYVIACMPAAAFVWTLFQTGTVTSGGTVVETIEWIPQLSIALSFRMDTLAWLLSLVVTGVGALVLLYCGRYFSSTEPGLGRFAALLFTFAGTMFGLVTADDIIVMFMFWEITSVLSYLLIGHYTDRKESRGAALQALLVTTFGGLVMLVGVIMISVQAQSTSLVSIVEQGLTGPATTVAILLILVGAISKSALVPFHFWLPAAMAAPTPVSAYLHAAAMVKAGIYLVARLAPGYADTPGWDAMLVGLGVLTMVAGAWRSLRQYDLKLVLAYGTVSQLGFLMVISGYGTRDSALAAVALLLAHAIYKAALFLVVGIIDHRAGTRDWRHLSGLGRQTPVLAVIAAIAVASMAGIPPLFGFVAKEAVFTSLLEGALEGDVWGWVAIIGTAVGSVLTVAYSARFLWGAFGDRRGAAPTELHAESGTIMIAPGILAVATIALGFATKPIDTVLAPYADSVGEGDYHLALWHGLEPALGISAVVVLLGLLLFRWRLPVARLQDRLPPLIDSSKGYWSATQGIDRLSAKVTLFAQRGGLVQYLSTILVVFVLTLGTIALLGRAWPSEIRLWDYPAQVAIAFIMATAAIAAARAKQRMAAVLLVGVTGFGLVALFALHGAPDLALTQALVETITIVVFVLVLRRLPAKIAQRNAPVHRVRRVVIGTLTGLVMGLIGVIALGARQAESIATELPRLAVEEGHGKNIVNVMLVDIRAWDTMGEISVLVVVATGIASLLFVSQRGAEVPRLSGARRRRIPGLRSQVVSDPHLADSEMEAPRDAVGRHTWLIGGRAIAEANRSILLEVLVRLLFHPAIVVSVFLLFVGHNEPGGGFAGGLLAGLALVMRYLAGGRYELGEAVPIDAGKVLGVGLLLAVGTAVGSLFFGGEALQSAYFSADVPILGHLSFGTSSIFDIGVYLVVVGLALDILRSLGAEVDRQQEEADIDEQSTDEFSASEAEQ